MKKIVEATKSVPEIAADDIGTHDQIVAVHQGTGQLYGVVMQHDGVWSLQIGNNFSETWDDVTTTTRRELIDLILAEKTLVFDLCVSPLVVS